MAMTTKEGEQKRSDKVFVLFSAWVGSAAATKIHRRTGSKNRTKDWNVAPTTFPWHPRRRWFGQCGATAIAQALKSPGKRRRRRLPGRSLDEVGVVKKRLYSGDRGALEYYSFSGIVVVGGRPAGRRDHELLQGIKDFVVRAKPNATVFLFLFQCVSSFITHRLTQLGGVCQWRPRWRQ